MSSSTGINVRVPAVVATRTGHAAGQPSSSEPRSQGESEGVGSRHSAVLVERANLSQRNLGAVRDSSPAIKLPVATMASRSTGRRT